MREVIVSTEYMSLSSAARRLGISRPTIYAWIQKGLLTRYVVGDEARILRAEVERLVAHVAL